ncbi:MAG TPA: gfo/Idh/MocA family oxidoreductase, partial [Polyangia bacterium]
RDPEPSGRVGLADLRVIEAIENAARSGRRLAVARVFPERRPTPGQGRRRGPHGRVGTVNVQPPSQQKNS